MLEEDWGHVADCTGEYLHLAKDLPSIDFKKQQRTFYMKKNLAIKEDFYMLHQDWEAREGFILCKESLKSQLTKTLLHRDQIHTQLDTHEKKRPEPTKGREH